MDRTIVVCALALLSACAKGDATPAPAQARPAAVRSYDAAQPPETTALPMAASTATQGPKASATQCDAAALALGAQTVVAKIGQREIKASDLDPKAAQAEAEALSTYCTTVSRIRQAAVDSAVEDALLASAAKVDGADVETYVRKHLESKVPAPTDADVERYYAQFKKDDAPPLEQVREQVVGAIRREASEAAYAALVKDLRSKTSVEMSLPDVRPAAREIDVPKHSPTFGPPGATVEVVEFSDFECPYCASAATIVNEVKKRYGDRVLFAYRHFPLSFHPNAKPAAEHAQCANEQGKFWEMHDAIFDNQRELGADGLKQHATAAGLDMGELQTCLASGRAAEAVGEDMAKALAVGVQGTPTFFVNGRQVEGGLSTEELAAAIDAELARAGV